MKIAKIIPLVFVLLFALSCKEKDMTPTDVVIDDTNLSVIAAEHSKALDYFFQQACEDGKKTNFQGLETRGINSNLINMEYIAKTLNSFEFTQLENKSQTRSLNDIHDRVNKYLDEFLPIVTKDLLSYENLEKNVMSFLDGDVFMAVEDDCKQHVKLSLLILLDSYNYWIVKDGLAKWILNIYSEEDRKDIEKQIGAPVPNDIETRSPGDMMVWRYAIAQDAQNGGQVYKAMKNDVYGFFTAIYGGLLGGAIGYATASAGAVSGVLD